MASSIDPGHFFQTSAALSESERKAAKSKNVKGNPIKLRSKILACAADPLNGKRIYAAEGGGVVEHVDIETGQVVATFAGPNAPLSCVAVTQHKLYAGCWDKNIYVWSLVAISSEDTSTPALRKAANVLRAGHADFVKALLVWPGANVLISGGSDGTIAVWDAEAGTRLHALTGHARGVQALAMDPVDTTREALVFFSGDSNREIRRWRVSSASASATQLPPTGPAHVAAGIDEAGIQPLEAHETSIYALCFDSDGDLWTASADKTAKCLARDRGWQVDTTLVHPDFVRDVAVDDDGGWVVTACRDEDIRVWEKGSGELFHSFRGHFEEVTGLLLLGATLVSVSIDATVRRWSVRRPDLEAAREEGAEQEERLGVEKEPEAAAKGSMLTEEEERELAELMEEDD